MSLASGGTDANLESESVEAASLAEMRGGYSDFTAAQHPGGTRTV